MDNTEVLTDEEMNVIWDWVLNEMELETPVTLDPYDFYEYPQDNVSLSDDVINFYDKDLEKTLYDSLTSKTLEYEQKKKSLDKTKVFLYVLVKNGVEEEYKGHPRLKDLVKLYWEWAWAMWTSQDLKELRSLVKQIKRLQLAESYAKRLSPGYRSKQKKGWYSEDDIEIANAISISDLIGDNIRKTGSKEVLKCPFHKEKTGSFFVYNDNSYHCFGCSAHGNGAVDFIMKRDNVDFPEAMKILLGR